MTGCMVGPPVTVDQLTGTVSNDDGMKHGIFQTI
jgi:hypothetical protein